MALPSAIMQMLFRKKNCLLKCLNNKYLQGISARSAFCCQNSITNCGYEYEFENAGGF